MYRPARLMSRKNDQRARPSAAAVPLGKAATDTSVFVNSPEAVQGSKNGHKLTKLEASTSRKVKPLTPTTNNEEIRSAKSEGGIQMWDQQNQTHVGRTPTPMPDENDQQLYAQQARPVPSLSVEGRTRTRTSSGGSRLHRKISWGKSKPKEEDQSQADHSKRASRLGMKQLEKELLPSLRDTVERMTGHRRSSIDCPKPFGSPDQRIQSPPPETFTSFAHSTLEHFSSPLQDDMTQSAFLRSPNEYYNAYEGLPGVSSPEFPRRTRSPRVDTSVDDKHSMVRKQPSLPAVVDLIFEGRTETNASESATTPQTFSGTISKPKSIQKSSLRPPWSVERKKSKDLLRRSEADGSYTESAPDECLLKSPQARSSSVHRSRKSSPLLSPHQFSQRSTAGDASSLTINSGPPLGLQSDNILSPNIGSRSPRILDSDHIPLSPLISYDCASRSPGLCKKSSCASIKSRLASPRITMSRAGERQLLSNNVTPKPALTVRNAQVEASTETETSADEHVTVLELPDRQTTPRGTATPRLSPHPSSGYSNYARSPTLTVVEADPSSSFEESEYEIGHFGRDADNSHARRRNELAKLVARITLDESNSSAAKSETPIRPLHTAWQLQLNDGASEYSLRGRYENSPQERQDLVGLALGGSTTSDVSVDRPPSRSRNSHKNSHLGTSPAAQGHISKSVEPAACEDSVSFQHPKSLRRHPPSPRSPMVNSGGNTDSLIPPKPGGGKDINRDSLVMLNASRQREAFGIPPSQSDRNVGLEDLSSAESDLSLRRTASESGWESESNQGLGLSFGAEKLFRNLGIGTGLTPAAANHSNTKRRTSWRSSMAEAERYIESTPRPMAISTLSSSSSIYDDDVPNRPWQKRDRDIDRVQNGGTSSNKSSWRKTVSQSAYLSLRGRHGDVEMRRQEAIWQLCESEQAFVKALRTTLKIFVYPLLGKNRSWISGLPASVTRLFDWLDDIFQLHAKISSALQHTRSLQYPVVLRIAETLRGFVPKLEIYQPYIVRLDEVVEEVETMMKDPGNDLGEFFRLQNKNAECLDTNFTTFLWLPLTRLGRYLKYFNELWELTPRSHVDHLATFSLLHSATTVIRVMREVKLREEEYAFVKDLVSRIHGLPDAAQLMRRERRLVAHGAMQRLHLSERCKAQLEGQCSSPDLALNARRCSILTSSRKVQHRRANSLDSCSMAELSDATSMASVSSVASNLNAHVDVENMQKKSSKSGLGDQSLRMSHGQSNRAHSSKMKTKTTPIYAFIFTDLALFTVPRRHRREESLEAWDLLDDLGICRVLALSDHSGKLGYDHLIGLHVLPMDVQQLESGVPSDTSSTSLFFHLPDGPKKESGHQNSARQRWWAALEQCYIYTLRSLSFPTYSGRYLAYGADSEQEQNNRQTVISILASGLPLPKSPSLQVVELEKDRRDNDTVREREERGWWALRFQQTLRELQQENPPSSALQRTSSSHVATTPRRTVASRRRLRLGKTVNQQRQTG